MADLGGYIRISSNIGDTFTNAINNDFLIYTQSNSQRIFISPSLTMPCIMITSNKIGINNSNPAYTLDIDGNLNYTGNLTANGSLFYNWNRNSSNVFVLGPSNIGIGKSNPAYSLDVVGDINLTGDVKLNGTRYDGSQWSNSSSNIFILSSNVGINKSNPAYNLDVNGNINVSGSITQNGILYGSLLYYDDTDPLIINSACNVSILKAQSTYKLLSSLGTSNNGFYKYLVNVSSNEVTLNIRDSNDTTTLQTFTIPASSNKMLTWYNSNWYGLTDVSHWSNTSSNVFILSSNVGIGKSNPSYALDVVGDINYTSNLRQNGNIISSWLNSSSNIYVLSPSNVGIFNSNPAYPLDVTGDINFTGVLRYNGTRYDGSQWSNNSSNVFIFSSNVGINKSNPVYPLEINGDMNVIGNIRHYGRLTGNYMLYEEIDALIINLTSNESILKTLTTYKLLSSLGTSNNGFYKYLVNASSNDMIINIRDSNDTTTLQSFTVPASSNKMLTWYNSNWYGLTDVGQWSNTSSNVFILGSNVGIGLSNPAYQLQLSTDSAAKPSTSTWTISSDERIKDNIILADLDRCYEIIKSIPLKKYTWKYEIYSDDQVKDRSKLGWIAQDVEMFFPKAVEKINQFGIEDCRTLNTDQIYAAMYGCIQKNQILIESLQTSYESLSERVSALENMISTS